jgi:transposase-like protein
MEIVAKILSQISSLDIHELYQIAERAKSQLEKVKNSIVGQVEESVNSCPHCHHESYIKWGKYSNKQRYKCEKCGQTFTATTGTVVHWLKKPDDFFRFAGDMFSEGFDSIKNEARRVGVSKTSGFSWRHRILISLKNETPIFKGMTEIDDVWFRYSQKGRKNLLFSRKRGRSCHQGDNNYQAKLLITKERGANLDISLVKIGRLSSEDVNQKLNGKIFETATLISDKHPSIAKFAKDEELRHLSFKASEHTGGPGIHVQTINQIAGELDENLNRVLNGVSTKYLQNYATWFVVLDKFKKEASKITKIIKESLSNIKAWDMNTNIEKIYAQFLVNHSVRTYRCPTQKTWKHQLWNFENAASGAYI